MKNMKGFSLIELVIVIVVLGIITAVALPKFVSITNNAKEAQILTTERNVETAITLFTSSVLADGKDGKVEINGVKTKYNSDNMPVFSERNKEFKKEVGSILDVNSLKLVNLKNGGFQIYHPSTPKDKINSCSVKYTVDPSTLDATGEEKDNFYVVSNVTGC